MIAFLSDAFNDLNRKLFENKLTNICFAININRKAIFHLCGTKIEIGVIFTCATKTEIIDDLIHCMIHIKNAQKGLSDCTSNQYHNQHFSSLAKSIGFYVEWHKTRGWSITRSNIEAESVCISQPNPINNKKLLEIISTLKINDECIEKLKNEIRKLVDQRPQKTYQLKYTCSCLPPNNTIRSGRRPNGKKPLDITCNICGAKFSNKN